MSYTGLWILHVQRDAAGRTKRCQSENLEGYVYMCWRLKHARTFSRVWGGFSDPGRVGDYGGKHMNRISQYHFQTVSSWWYSTTTKHTRAHTHTNTHTFQTNNSTVPPDGCRYLTHLLISHATAGCVAPPPPPALPPDPYWPLKGLLLRGSAKAIRQRHILLLRPPV